MLLADGITALNVRAQLRQRFKASAERVIANVDLFLEMSRAYDVRGLLVFARDMTANWEEAKRQVEGRPDAEHEAVSLAPVIQTHITSAPIRRIRCEPVESPIRAPNKGFGSK